MARTTKGNTKMTKDTKKTTKKTPVEKEAKDKRTFVVFYDNTDINTHPKGYQPRQAARKAVVPIIKYRLAKDGITDKKDIKNNTKYIDKKFIFYTVDKSDYSKYLDDKKKAEQTDKKKKGDNVEIVVHEPARHYYMGERTSINKNIADYLTVGSKKDNTKRTIDINEFKGRITIKKGEGKNEKIYYATKYEGEGVDPNIDVYKGNLYDKDIKVIRVEIPRTFNIYKTTKITGPDGKEITKKVKTGETKTNYIEHKYSNTVFKLTLAKYNEIKDELKLSKKEEEELLKYIDKPKRAPAKDKEEEPANDASDDEPKKPAPKRGGRSKKEEADEPKPAPKRGRKPAAK